MQEQIDSLTSPFKGRHYVFTAPYQGGVGKSVICMLLFEALRRRGIRPVAIDADYIKQVGALYHSYGKGGVIRYDLSRPEALDELLKLPKEQKLVLVDLGAGAEATLVGWLKPLAARIRKFGAEMTLICPIGQGAPPIDGLFRIASQIQHDAGYIVVLNQGESPYDKFESWEQHDRREEFLEKFKPLVVKLPSLSPKLLNAVQKYGVSISAIAEVINVPEHLRTSDLMFRAGHALDVADQLLDQLSERLLSEDGSNSPAAKKGAK